MAAAGEQDDGNDDEPDIVVVEEIAKAVVHKSFLHDLFSAGTPALLLSLYGEEWKRFVPFVGF